MVLPGNENKIYINTLRSCSIYVLQKSKFGSCTYQWLHVHLASRFQPAGSPKPLCLAFAPVALPLFIVFS